MLLLEVMLCRLAKAACLFHNRHRLELNQVSLSRLLQVQTIKTAVESATMLLRIDDIVSGLSKKSKAGPSQTGPQADDGDNVSLLHAV